MAELKNEIGKKYGYLTVIEKVPSPYPNRTHAYYRCKCDCGNEQIACGTELRSGHVSSCGCKKKEEHHSFNLSLIGTKFGNLTIVSPDTYKKGKYYWNCQCTCGAIISTSESNLKTNKSKACVSCGKKIGSTKKALKLITPGETFGYLTVIEKVPSPSKKTTNAYFKCKCKCGNGTVVESRLLRKGITRSCGCLNESFGELEIKEILKKFKLIFKKEQSFPDLLSDKGHNLRFDFAIKSSDSKKIYFLIEYDGIQHYEEIKFFHSSLKEIQIRDKQKNQYCQLNNIPLLRIPYWDFNKIEEIIKNFIQTNFNFLITDKNKSFWAPNTPLIAESSLEL